MSRAKERELVAYKDEDYVPSPSDNNKTDDNYNNNKNKYREVAEGSTFITSSIPDSWYFPGYTAFVAWGPFAVKNCLKSKRIQYQSND